MGRLQGSVGLSQLGQARSDGHTIQTLIETLFPDGGGSPVMGRKVLVSAATVQPVWSVCGWFLQHQWTLEGSGTGYASLLV